MAGGPATYSQVNVSVSGLIVVIALFIPKYRQLPREPRSLMLLQSYYCQPSTPPDISALLNTSSVLDSSRLLSVLVELHRYRLMCRYHAVSKLEIGAETI